MYMYMACFDTIYHIHVYSDGEIPFIENLVLGLGGQYEPKDCCTCTCTFS